MAKPRRLTNTQLAAELHDIAVTLMFSANCETPEDTDAKVSECVDRLNVLIDRLDGKEVMTTMPQWNGQSGVRERLALVAAEGPTVNPDEWMYNSRRDAWDHKRVYRSIRCAQEGTKSLELIAERWQMDRRAALAFIGYPES